MAAVVSLTSIVVGGWWTYSHFIEFREGAENLNVTLTSQTTHITTGAALLTIDVALKNIGKVPIIAERLDPNDPNYWCTSCGLDITVIVYDDASKGRSSTDRIIDWDSGGGGTKYVVNHYNVLQHYPGHNYALGPGVEYHETAIVQVDTGKLYAIRARFFSANGWTNADIKYVYVSPEKSASVAEYKPE
ncbi:hypothetical protein RugamoR64_39480 [Duganella rhizosphaerae]